MKEPQRKQMYDSWKKDGGENDGEKEMITQCIVNMRVSR